MSTPWQTPLPPPAKSEAPPNPAATKPQGGAAPTKPPAFSPVKAPVDGGSAATPPPAAAPPAPPAPPKPAPTDKNILSGALVGGGAANAPQVNQPAKPTSPFGPLGGIIPKQVQDVINDPAKKLENLSNNIPSPAASFLEKNFGKDIGQYATMFSDLIRDNPQYAYQVMSMLSPDLMRGLTSTGLVFPLGMGLHALLGGGAPAGNAAILLNGSKLAPPGMFDTPKPKV